MKIDILVPVLDRPQNIPRLVRSLIDATRTPYRLLFLCSPGYEAEIEACRAHGETHVMEWSPERGDFARKINWAFEHTDSEWLFQGADDIRFEPGWDRQALRIAGRSGRGVIGTNDLHNPGVLKKIASTHTLFSRAYIDKYGGTTDNTGKVFCELYDHQFVDTEFIETAKSRHQFAFAQHSIVEHLHPYFGGAEMDSTYTKALRHTANDQQLYRKRRAAIRADERGKARKRRLEDLRAR